MKWRSLLAAVLGCGLLGTTSPTAAQKQEILESNEDGEIMFTQPTKAGNVTLQPGAYLVQLRGSADRHFIRFMRVEESLEFRATRIFTGWYTDTREHNAGDVECRVEPLGATVQATTVTIASENAMPRITRVMVKGEAGVCTF
jgi:hypothetical protein